jgi:hypothetical protein
MWEPVGPLPASVYWRRRGVAVASVVMAVVLLVWAVGVLTAPGDPVLTPVSGDAAPAPVVPGPAAPAIPLAAPTGPATTSPTDQPTAGPDPTTPGPGGTAPPAGTAGPAASSPATGNSGASSPATSTPVDVARAEGGPDDPTSTSGTSERIRPDDTPRPPVAVASPVPVPQSGPVPCTDAMLATAAEVDRPEHRVGERPVFRLVITNVSGQPCVRDLDSVRQEVVVWSADLKDRLWSSNDCVNGSSIDLRTLVPGQPVAFSVAWAGRTTTPGCAQPRTVVPAGPYQVMTRLDDVISPPTPFTRLP